MHPTTASNLWCMCPCIDPWSPLGACHARFLTLANITVDVGTFWLKVTRTGLLRRLTFNVVASLSSCIYAHPTATSQLRRALLYSVAESICSVIRSFSYPCRQFHRHRAFFACSSENGATSTTNHRRYRHGIEFKYPFTPTRTSMSDGCTLTSCS